ncbi:MAG TPA: winged helix-turn-helix domain-containing protein [Gammaproteobacteria bacterium]
MPIRLGQLEIHAELNEICGPAGRQRVEPQAVTVLELLAGDPGRVFSRDDLLDRAWRGRIVSDATLSGVISRLRRALVDAGVEDMRIETRSKRGYVLVHSTQRSRRRTAPGRRIAVLIALIAALSTGTWYGYELRSGLESLEGVRLDFDITFPDGEMSDAVIWLEEGSDGRISLSGEYPLDIRVIPGLAEKGLLRLRIEAGGLAHWTGFEQVIGLGTESHFILKSETANAFYSIRFVASLEPPPGLPQEIPR